MKSIEEGDNPLAVVEASLACLLAAWVQSWLLVCSTEGNDSIRPSCYRLLLRVAYVLLSRSNLLILTG